MALLTALDKVGPSESRRKHSTCAGTWRRASRDGEPLIQIDTFGSPEREDPGTVSQSIQIDRATAAVLLDAIHKTFPDLGRGV